MEASRVNKACSLIPYSQRGYGEAYGDVTKEGIGSSGLKGEEGGEGRVVGARGEEMVGRGVSKGGSQRGEFGQFAKKEIKKCNEKIKKSFKKQKLRSSRPQGSKESGAYTGSFDKVAA